MSDISVLIGKQLRYGVEQVEQNQKMPYDVDLSMYSIDEIRSPIVSRMIDEFRQLYTFKLNEEHRIVTVTWSPSQPGTRRNPQEHGRTTRLTRRRS